MRMPWWAAAAIAFFASMFTLGVARLAYEFVARGDKFSGVMFCVAAGTVTACVFKVLEDR
jgi:hypothetical protein